MGNDLVKSYQIMESFFWKWADILASINPEIEMEQRRMGASNTAQLRFCAWPEPRLEEAKSFNKRSGTAFMGYNNKANREAIEWILSKLLRPLGRRHPSIHLHIIGTVEPSKYCKKKRAASIMGKLITTWRLSGSLVCAGLWRPSLPMLV